MAQSVERRLGKAEVTGPIPVSSLQKNPGKSKFDLSGFFIECLYKKTKSIFLLYLFYHTKIHQTKSPQFRKHPVIFIPFLAHNTFMNKLKRYTILGILFVIITGTLSHFVYEWSGNNFILGFFFPVNESTWEHMKLCFFPMLVYSFFMNKRLKDDYPCVTSALLFGILLGTFFIPVLFYTYSGILGQNYVPLDIATFILSVLLAFIAVYRLSLSCVLDSFLLCLKILVFLMTVCFLVFTYHPPGIGLFAVPVM